MSIEALNLSHGCRDLHEYCTGDWRTQNLGITIAQTDYRINKLKHVVTTSALVNEKKTSSKLENLICAERK